MRKGVTLHTRRLKAIAHTIPAVCLLLALSSCGVRGKHMPLETYRTPDDPGVLATSEAPLSTSGIERNYLIGLRDVIEVDVAEHTEFSGNFKVAEDGTVEIPTVYKRVRVSSLNTGQAAARIRDLLDKLVVGHPQVRVKVLVSRSRYYFMLGAVGREGKYFMGLEDVTVRDAMLSARLWGAGAKKDKVHIITPDERDRVSYVVADGESILMGGLRDNVVLKPGDIVYVPTTLYFKINCVIDEILFQAERARDMDDDVTYGRQVGRDGYGRLEDATSP